MSENNASSADTAELQYRASSSSNVSSSLSLPHFKPENPQLWIKLVSSAFKAYNITNDSQKVYLCICALPSELQDELSNNLTAELQSFDDLKDELIAATSIPEQKRMKQLLTDTQMNGRKPSHYLRHLRELAGPETDRNNSLVRSIFLQRLPNRVLMIAAPTPEQSADEIAELADRIFEHMEVDNAHSINNVQLNANTPAFIPHSQSSVACDKQINAISADLAVLKADSRKHSESLNNSNSSLHQQICALQQNFNAFVGQIQTQMQVFQQQIANLQKEVIDIKSERQSRSHIRDQRGYSSRSTSGVRLPTSSNRNGLCYYHETFKSRARKCNSPCTWKEVNSPKNAL